jgi:hypothetical protein
MGVVGSVEGILGISSLDVVEDRVGEGHVNGEKVNCLVEEDLGDRGGGIKGRDTGE